MPFKRIAKILVIGGALIVLLAACYLGYQALTRSTVGLIEMEMSAPGLVGSRTLTECLSSDDRDLVMTALNILEERRDPAGKEKALELLSSDDDYIWFNAAQYLGAIKEQASVPYLIKGLKHPAWGAHDEVAARLEDLTAQEFGKDQKKWIAWWREKNPADAFDFEYQNLKREALGLDSNTRLPINGVVDPVRISHMGAQIRLLGLKLKEGADTQKAVTQLKTAVLYQLVQLRFDNAPKLDEEGARPALVYWTGRDDPRLSRFRTGLPPVPFTEKTLVQSYLLRSGLYELDVSEVTDPMVKKELEDALNSAPGPNIFTE